MSRAPRLAGQRCWVVGASSGIGAALASELLARGAHVAISARREDRLEAVSQGHMVVSPCDVTDPEGTARAADTVRERLGAVDLVVWSAGTWQQFDALEWDRQAFARHIEVNLLGLNNLLAVVLPPMVADRAGHLVGIASVAGYRGLAGAEAYGATKAAQLNLLESLRVSLSGKGIRVTTVAPGFVRTEMTEANTFPMPFLIDPDQAAHAIADGLERGDHEIVFPLPMALLMKAASVLPVRAWDAIAGRLARSGTS
ncbi:MAG: SDR family NAD(P)-dependent oxidoreductase [Intrasporangium sp.]|uniref:SDR family NAD(P)-dependent oxidoreductase n=1 Tax=Intrasporangium sp. TaxID=1925024 RepID=UPI0026476C02|nr:SDR family NAD(P)-dependent oxidoreductase [Intrasporangium sp.]MDN5796175.1 SDR family NAD(P)-dependent oxidoreductase [Intrasporangium sp.]